MPELPEVETVTAGLHKQILGASILAVRVNRHDLRIPIPSNLPDLLLEQKITTVERRAKYILIHLANNHILIIHLGMSGKVLINPTRPPQRHDHFVLTLNNNVRVVFNDPRRFGLVTICPYADLDQLPFFTKTGPEPLSPAFNSLDFLASLKNRSTPIKTTIMNNEIVVGIGNIYACEALFRSQISPLHKSNTLTLAQVDRLIPAIKQTLLEAIAAGGSSLRDYVSTSGDLGYFQNQLQVYGRTDLPCTKCQAPIVKIKQSGRSTFYCQNCQA